MRDHLNHRTQLPEHRFQNESYGSIDYRWFDTQFQGLLERLAKLEHAVTGMEQHATPAEQSSIKSSEREFYSVQEFAAEVQRGEYTVREWCRLERINAEKCESGRGDAKSWKIPAEELARYRDHGLLPRKYLR